MSFQSFAGSKITTGDGGNAHSGATGGRGGDVGSSNKNFDTQRFDNANLKTGGGGDADMFSTGGHGGDIGSENNSTGLKQDFRDSELRTGHGGLGSCFHTTGGRGGDIGSNN